MKGPRKKSLVIGLGNPLFGDDGFGGRVVESLSHQSQEPFGEVALVDAHTDLLNQIEDFCEYQRVILIDAILDPQAMLGPAGQIAVFRDKDLLSWPETSPGVHQMSPLLAVKLFRSLHPEAVTQFLLVGLLVDRLGHAPLYATDARIQEGAETVSNILL